VAPTGNVTKCPDGTVVVVVAGRVVVVAGDVVVAGQVVVDATVVVVEVVLGVVVPADVVVIGHGWLPRHGGGLAGCCAVAVFAMEVVSTAIATPPTIHDRWDIEAAPVHRPPKGVPVHPVSRSSACTDRPINVLVGGCGLHRLEAIGTASRSVVGCEAIGIAGVYATAAGRCLTGAAFRFVAETARVEDAGVPVTSLSRRPRFVMDALQR
jgi:hypothetical protein